MRYKSIFILVIAILSSSISFCQDNKVSKFNTRDIRIYYEEEAPLQAKELFVTTDGGKKWKNAESVCKVRWGKDGKGANAIFTAPSDGTYGFAFRFGDTPEHIEPPQSGEVPELTAIINTISQEIVTTESTIPPDIASAKEHYQRGVLLVASDKIEQAMNEFEKAIAFWPNYKDALDNIASIYYDKGNHGKALEHFIRARKACPSNPVSYVNTALAYSKLNMQSEVLQEISNGIELGLDKKNQQLEEAELMASEILWQIAKGAIEAKDEKTATTASNMILKIPFSTPQARSDASSIIQVYKKPKS